MPPNVPTDPNRRWWLRRLLNRLEVDRAVFYAVLVRGWQLLAGPVTLVLIAHFFTPNLQGYYYTFSGVLALQSFVELGLHIVIINLASHEWSKLKLNADGQIGGDPDALSRLVSLGRFIFKWYAAAALVFVVGVGIAGVVFFSLRTDQSVDWMWPWLTLVLLTGLLLWTLPFNALLEGCNQVATVNRFRILQAAGASLTTWACLSGGAGLWAAAAAAAMKLAWDLYLLFVHYGRFFGPFFSRETGPIMKWKTEIWPLQWRLGVQGVFAYFSFQLFTPVMFHFHNPALAGRMGMTWAALTVIQAASLAWVQTRAPRFGMLIAQKKYDELDRIFKRLTILSMAVGTVASLLFLGVVLTLGYVLPRYAERLLDPLSCSVFAMALMVLLLVQCQSIYIRAHKQELFMKLGIISSILIGGSVVLLGQRENGPLGAGCGLLAVSLFFTLPYATYLWQCCRAMRD